MSRTNLFLKIEVEHDAEENPEKIGDELCRQLQRHYGVLSAEISNYTKVEE
ncbi:MAG TPA: hypothetical protein VN736_12350 [Candidatus Limnocylindrales bacterium]|nr:hypothetical protein [Candidatus Limnocylindrales bacterium]